MPFEPGHAETPQPKIRDRWTHADRPRRAGRAAEVLRPGLSSSGDRTAVLARNTTVRAAPGLHGIDVDARAGEIVGILGPNGAGKSTLLRVIATCIAPTAGTLQLLDGNALPPSRALRRRIGYAADEAVHFDALSGHENAMFFARATGLDSQGAERAVQRLFERFDLARDAARRVREYSHGMCRKLLLAQALAHAPLLIVLDEPTLGLDPPSRIALADLLRERARAGATVVLATHDVLEAQHICTRVIFVDQGRIMLEGAPADLLRRFDTASRIEVELSAATTPRLHIAGATVVRATPERVELRASLGGAVLPRLCATLVEQGMAIRSIHVREPNLGDLFEHLTGGRLNSPSCRDDFCAAESGSGGRRAAARPGTLDEGSVRNR